MSNINIREFIFWKWYLTLGNRELVSTMKDDSGGKSLNLLVFTALCYTFWFLKGGNYMFLSPTLHLVTISSTWQSQCILSVMLLTFISQWTTKNIFNCFNTLYYLYCHSDGLPSSTEIQQPVQIPPSYYWSLSLLKYHNLCKKKIKVVNVNK